MFPSTMSYDTCLPTRRFSKNSDMRDELQGPFMRSGSNAPIEMRQVRIIQQILDGRSIPNLESGFNDRPNPHQ